MCSQPGNWQDAIDKIWHDAAEKGDLVSFSASATDLDKVRFTVKKEFLRSITWLRPYLTNCVQVQHKSAVKAKQLRNNGNKLFQKKAFQEALDLYTQSILYSPVSPSSTELALGYGNRSAVLYHQSRHTACIRDIEMAFKWGFPEHNHHKLHQRFGQCLLKQGKVQCARKRFMQALSCLESQSQVDPKKKEEIEGWLEKTNGFEEAASATDDKQELSPPVVSYGPNPILTQATQAVSLQYSAAKGRHLVADQCIAEGDTLIVERPFAAVLLPDHYDTHCHHCFDKLNQVYPCVQCARVRFCSPQCQTSAWDVYHQYECTYLEILHSIGIAHLSLRVVLVAGLQTIRDLRSGLSDPPQPGHVIEGVNERGLYDTDYWAVYHLMPHTDDMVTDDLFQYALTAALLSEILLGSKFLEIQRTRDSKKSGLVSEIAEVTLSERAPHSVTQEEFDFICGLLLRHIQQLVCNAHAITELQAAEVRKGDSVETNSQVRVATAIYPTASLMNHSCDPTIISSFCKDTLVVRSVKDVPVGGEIFNCYGPHCKRMSRTERQESLKGQYFFTCTCEACQQGEYNDQVFQAFRCVQCEGPVCLEGGQLCCRACGQNHKQDHVAETITKSQGLFVEGLTLLEKGDIKGALCKLEACYDVQRQTLYKHNRDLAHTQDCLARCWAMLGNLDKSAIFLEESLETMKLVYGERSVEVGNELSKLAGILFNNHQVAKALPVINQSQEILQIHYGSNHSSLSELTEMKDCLLKLQNGNSIL